MFEWSIKMAKGCYPANKDRIGQPTSIHLIPVNETRFSDPNRISELHTLVARIVLISSKRGRPSHHSREESCDAA
jgi:hypothetical protein